MCFRWIAVAVITMVALFLCPNQTNHLAAVASPMLAASITALSIVLASVAIYQRDFIAEIDLFLRKPDQLSRRAGEAIARDYKNSFGLLLTVSVFLGVAVLSLITVVFFQDSLLTRAVALWAFISGIGSLAVFLLSFTVRLVLDAAFFEKEMVKTHEHISAQPAAAVPTHAPPGKPPEDRQRGLGSSKLSILAVIGLGYLLILISSGTFLAILYINNGPSPVKFDVVPIDGMTWIELEKLYAETVLSLNHLAIKAEHRLDMIMIYNFSTLPVQITVSNEGNLTLPDFMVQVLIEDETGHIRGVGSAALRVSTAGEPVVQKVFLYNVPVLLRGQELRIHVLSMIQRATIVVHKELLLVRTFPRLEEGELPRILLFFLTFSALPVSVFLPFTLKQRAEDWWRRVLERNSCIAVLLILSFAIVLAGYWDYVCKVFCFF